MERKCSSKVRTQDFNGLHQSLALREKNLYIGK